MEKKSFWPRSIWLPLGWTMGVGVLAWVILGGLFCFKGCAQNNTIPTAAQPELPKVMLHIGKAHVDAEIADTPSELECGLMFRQKLGDNDGMIFTLGNPKRAIFWMENTLLPLSIAYLDASGRVVEVYDMKPFDRTAITSKSDRIAYALEVNQGWFQLNGISPGTLVEPVGAVFGKPPLTLITR